MNLGLMLQKQAPASTIPRFNPHGYQPPPQERKKEDPTSPSKKFPSVVKKRAEADEIVDFSKFNIEDLLLDMVSIPFFKFQNSALFLLVNKIHYYHFYNCYY